MTFADRFWDDDGFVPFGTPEIIPIVGLLLERLDLETASRPQQIDGIRQWLRANTPPPSLLQDIEDRGYAEALDEYRADSGHRVRSHQAG